MIIRVLLSLLLLLPFFYLPGSYNPYELPKAVVGIIGIEVCFLFFVLSLWKKKDPIRFSRLSVLAIFYGGVVCVADLLGIDVKISLIGSIYRYQGFLLLGACILLFLMLHMTSQAKQRQYFDFFIVGVYFSAIGLTLFALIQILVSSLFPSIYVPLYQGRIVGTMGNPNFLGGILAMYLPLVMLAKAPQKNYLWFFSLTMKISLSALMLFVLWETASRGALLAVVFLICVVCVHFLKKRESFLGKVSVLVIIVMVLIGAYVSYQTMGKGRVSWWDNRGLIWYEGIDGFKHNPILGIGQENFELLSTNTWNMKADNAHNIFLEVAVASGIVGLLLFVCIIGFALKKANVPVRLAILVFLIVAQFNPLSIAQLVFFWCLLGISEWGNVRLTN